VRSFTSVLVAALAIASSTGTAQAQGRYHWTEDYPGPSPHDERAVALALGSHGEVFVAASIQDLPDDDALVLAYDAYGQRRWERNLDSGANEFATEMFYDGTSDALYVGGGISVPPTILIWKLDPQSGAVIWQRSYSGPQQQGCSGRMARSQAGGFHVAGYESVAGQTYPLLVRFDADGQILWTWTHASSGSVVRTAVDANGDIVLIRSTSSLRTLHRIDAMGVELWSRALDTGQSAGPVIDSASNILYALSAVSDRVEKRDANGNLLWSRTTASIFGPGSDQPVGIAVTLQDDIVVVSGDNVIACIAPAGNARWTTRVPPTQWFDIGLYSGLAVDSNGEIVFRSRCHTPSLLLDYDAVTRFDSNGNFLWSQAIRGTDPSTQIETQPMLLARQGSVILGGYSKATETGPENVFVAAIREQSHSFCAGDGSAGPCPCGNNAPPGIVGGCRSGGAFPVPARLDDQGIASLGDDSLRFFASSLAPNGACTLLQGQAAGGSVPFQDGLLCLTGPLVRIHGANASGLNLDLPPAGGGSISSRSAALGDPILPGSSRAYQVYFRGGSGACAPANGNLTNGIVVGWGP
jgi:outer membrane protein assembly factor BamB